VGGDVTESPLAGVQRIGVKLYLEDPSGIDLSRLVPVFHGWIQRGAVPGLLIDVADYAHVPEGPGVMLIAHEADYALDLGEGRPGVVYQRKRDATGSVQDRLETAIAMAIRAAHELELEPSLDGLRVRTDELLVKVVDRLRAPAAPETLDALRPDLLAAVAAVYGDVTPGALTPVDDPTGPFAVRLTIPEAPGLHALAGRVAAGGRAE
jgi:hypothetical protein